MNINISNKIVAQLFILFSILFGISSCSNKVDNINNLPSDLKNEAETSSHLNKPIYDYTNNTIKFNNHIYQMNQEVDQEKDIMNWINNILINEVPDGDFDQDGIINELDDDNFSDLE